jgi:hypothetical protein
MQSTDQTFRLYLVHGDGQCVEGSTELVKYDQTLGHYGFR